MKRICTLCARGGSKSVPNKNIRKIAGKPLIAYSILQARQTGLFQIIAVSSDSDLILETAKQWGADLLIKRPEELATDTAAKIPAIRHCVQEAEKITGQQFDTIVDLDATSPLRNTSDIIGCVNLLESKKISNVITGSKARRSPYFNLVEINSEGAVVLSKTPAQQVVRRQDTPDCFDLNASIYVWRRDVLFASNTVFNHDSKLFAMPEDRSIDIDSEFDFEIVEFVLQKREAVAAV